MIKRTLPPLLVAAGLALGGCATAPTTSELGAVTFAGAVAGSLLKTEAPEITPYLPTIQGALRSLSGPTAPSVDRVQATVQTWVNKLPISDAAKGTAVASVVRKYEEAQPVIAKADNTALYLEAFVSAF